jgi:predicted transcriptional regulator
MKNKFRDNTCQIAYDADSYIITIEKKHNYNILIEISPNHKNYQVIKNIGYFLNKTNNTWKWLLTKANIPKATMKSYLSGREYITLNTIEKIVSAFDGIINSPRKLMNLEYPVLKGGSDFKLNINEIMTKYRINRGDLSIATGIDNASISNYFNGVNKQIRIETIINFFNFFKTKGVPLNNHADLIYFPNHREIPLHFIIN